jgi:hypothetical protein
MQVATGARQQCSAVNTQAEIYRIHIGKGTPNRTLAEVVSNE